MAELSRLRRELVRDFGARVVDGGAGFGRVLVCRVPVERPDLLNDMAKAAEHVAPAVVRGVSDVLLIGDAKVVRVDPIQFRDAMRDIERDDVEAANVASARLPGTTEAAATFVAVPEKSSRLVVRITAPVDVSDRDAVLRAVLRVTGPDIGKAAETGATRLAVIPPTGEPLGFPLREAIERAARGEEIPFTEVAASAHGERAPADTALRGETPSVLAPGGPNHLQVEGLRSRFEAAGYEIIDQPRIEGTTFRFAAHKRGVKRFLVYTVGEADETLLQRLDAPARASGADAVIVMAERIVQGTRLAAMGSIFEIMTTGEVGTLEL